jgi:simple sugar transport system permease protein
MSFVKKFGWPRVIIAVFLIALFIIAPFVGLDPTRSFIDVMTRFGMNSVLVLSMIPMIQSGCGLNFGLPVGLIAGMLGAVISMELKLTGLPGVLAAMLIGVFFALIFGFLYGKLLNKVKGDEMIIATYVGYSFVALMNMMWIVLPFKNPALVQGFKGEGLRTTIDLTGYWDKAISYFPFKITIKADIVFPLGMFILFALIAFFVWTFFKTKTGTAMTAVGSNPDYARAAGINVDKMRLFSVMLSSAIAAVGMILYEQSFGFVQMFNAPLAFAFPSVAAILLGGASVNKANIANVFIGAFLFQGILTMTPSVINSAINIDISEVLRIIISNGMIVYALTRKEQD